MRTIFIPFLFYSILFPTEYSSQQVVFSANGLTVLDIDVSDSGTITDLNVKINMTHNRFDGLRYISIALLSPSGISIHLADGDQIGATPYWESNNGNSNTLYNSIFDDEAYNLIYDTNSPFSGLNQPEGTLSGFDSQSVTGTWQLLFTNSSSNDGTVEFSVLVDTLPVYEGNVVYVSPDGQDWYTGSINFPFATIQAGINATSDGDTVLVQPGTYVENINYNGKNIVVGSLTLTTGDTSYISQTVIDGNQSGGVVIFENGGRFNYNLNWLYNSKRFR